MAMEQELSAMGRCCGIGPGAEAVVGVVVRRAGGVDAGAGNEAGIVGMRRRRGQVVVAGLMAVQVRVRKGRGRCRGRGDGGGGGDGWGLLVVVVVEAPSG